MYYKERETKSPIIYCVFRNSDFTEGRGPMVLDSIWNNYEEAAKYIDNQPGIQGKKAKWSQSLYGDWEIKKMPIFQHIEDKQAIDNALLKQKALAKLTIEERKVLGLI